MGSESGSAEAVRDWFPLHAPQFDTNYAQGIFLAWTDFPWCTTCDPEQMPGPRPSIFDYLQYTEYFLFNSENACGGATDPDIFHCDYWGIEESTNYYADFDIFAYFNPPAVNRAYKNWNSDGSALVRTVDRQIKHLLYRLYISPFTRFDAESSAVTASSIQLDVENIGFLRSSIMTAARNGVDPLTERFYDNGNIEVSIWFPRGFTIIGPNRTNVGWLGGNRADDPAPNNKSAIFAVKGLSVGDSFVALAESDKTGRLIGEFKVVRLSQKCADQARCPVELGLKMTWTNHIDQPQAAMDYFLGGGVRGAQRTQTMLRGTEAIRSKLDQDRANRQEYRQIEGPFVLIPGKAQGVVVKKYH
jgi:hypothetical protein